MIADDCYLVSTTVFVVLSNFNLRRQQFISTAKTSINLTNGFVSNKKIFRCWYAGYAIFTLQTNFFLLQTVSFPRHLACYVGGARDFPTRKAVPYSHSLNIDRVNAIYSPDQKCKNFPFIGVGRRTTLRPDRTYVSTLVTPRTPPTQNYRFICGERRPHKYRASRKTDGFLHLSSLVGHNSIAAPIPFLTITLNLGPIIH